MKRIPLIILITLLLCGTVSAQRRRAKAKPVVPEKTAEEKLYDELLPSTAKVMFIDSVTVSKDEFLGRISLPSELGSLTAKDGDVTYTNEFGNVHIIASGDTVSGRHLYRSYLYGKSWDMPQQIEELGNVNPDYPFLMADGVTLYFSAEGEGTVGGRDIFRTTYDADGSRFYEATNMGLPFNSPANDYLLAISDLDMIGWLVTDRNQPEGMVCIYTFEPTTQRQTFDEDTDENVLKSFAAIGSIEDTWAFGNRDAAMARKAKAEAGVVRKAAGWKFVVNDQVTYTSLDEFSSDAARRKFQSLQEDKERLSQLNALLDSNRDRYEQAPKAKRYEIARQIVALEEEVESLDADIAAAEKELRNLENK